MSAEPLRAIRGGADPVPAKFAKHWREFDAEYQHPHPRYRPFHMHRVESFIRRAPEHSRWQLYLLLNRVSDDGSWKGKRLTLMHLLGWQELSYESTRRRLGELRKRGLITCRWYGDGSGWLRITGLKSLMDGEKGL